MSNDIQKFCNEEYYMHSVIELRKALLVALPGIKKNKRNKHLRFCIEQVNGVLQRHEADLAREQARKLSGLCDHVRQRVDKIQ